VENKTVKEREIASSRMQRIEALLNNERIDRVPLWFMMEGFCSKTAGYEISSFYTDINKSFWSQVWTYEMYEIDEDPRYQYGACGAWEFGGEIKYPSGEWMQAPSVVRNPVTNEQEAWELKMPDIKSSGFIPNSMEFAKLQQKFGMFIQPHIGDPFVWAGNVCSPDLLMRWVYRNPAIIHHIMELVTDYLVGVMRYWVDTFGGERIIPWTPSSTSSNALISKRHVEEFVLPYVKEINEKGLKMGIKHFHHHLCGEHNFNLPLWRTVPRGDPGIITCAPEVDLDDMIKYFGETCIIGGNVSPPLIQTGSPQEVYEAARQCIKKAKNAPRGFILMSGCDVPPNTPPYNMYTLLKAVKDFGRYE
jgi:uroporphyrinogen decarboxylase